MEEIWKDIEGYEGLYQVSNQGRVRSYKSGKETILKNTIRGDGYQFVSLCNKSKPKQAYIHKLVAQYFIPNPNNLPIVNHKDCNPSNNSIENLEWCSYSYNNSYDGAGKKRREACRDKNYVSSPVSCLVYNKTGELIGEFPSIKAAADYTDCNFRDVWKIVNGSGRAKSSHGFIFKKNTGV